MPNLSARSDTAEAIADELDAHGFVCLKDAIGSDWLTDARSEVEALLRTRGERFHFIRNAAGEEYRSVETMVNSHLGDLLEDVMRARLAEATAELTTADLRVVAGPPGKDDAYAFHYDASAITMVVPLFVPNVGRGRSGELIGFFNKRPFRRSVLVNLLDKLIWQSGMYRRFILRSRDRVIATMVEMEVGNAYLFWGYRSLHANLPCAPGGLRATLVIHLGQPHGSNRLLLTAARIQRSVRGLWGHPKPITSQASSPQRELVPAA